MKVSLTDSHVHLNDDSIYTPEEEVMLPSTSVLINSFVLLRVSIGTGSSIAMNSIVHAAVGFHPAVLARLTGSPICSGNEQRERELFVGEIGLD